MVIGSKYCLFDNTITTLNELTSKTNILTQVRPGRGEELGDWLADLLAIWLAVRQPVCQLLLLLIIPWMDLGPEYWLYWFAFVIWVQK